MSVTALEANRLWLALLTQQRRLGLAARQLLTKGGKLALNCVPDLSLEAMLRLSHAALMAQGAESWTAPLAGHRVHRYAFAGRGEGPPVLLLHGLGGQASSMAPLVPGLTGLARRVVLLELPGHGRSPEPLHGPLSAREYGAVAIACAEELQREHDSKVVLVGNSLGGALALYTAHERPELCAGVAGLNPAGAELSDEAVNGLPRAFSDANQGAAQMAALLFHRTPWPFWLVARDFARHWGTSTVQRILDDARTGNDRSLGMEVLTDIHVPVLIVWGKEDRLLPLRSVEDFARIEGARVEIIEGCGHVPQLERPAAARRAVADFLRSLKS
ncbi:MAG: alpha/beta fold hydrolase [Deltaproteobacteria bacterium]|nr:MAG: alpha/beta fold hydrolase [Deltaproteobacteria bacterium]